MEITCFDIGSVCSQEDKTQTHNQKDVVMNHIITWE